VSTGAFVRQDSRFRGTPHGGPERHHLYVALACPWSQRAVIARAVLDLDIGMSLAHPYRDERGWAFPGGRFTDAVNGWDFLERGYRATDPDYDGRVSVPVLWDKQDGVIVSNESADIIRIFDEWADGDLYPEPLREEIDALNDWIYTDFQNGVYRAGFARSQEAYEEAFRGVFASLDRLDAHLATRRYLLGDAITEADWRLLPTLLRFDAVYHTHFRCNGKRLIEYPNVIRYAADLYSRPRIAETFALDEVKRHYYTTHDELNPKRIIPSGPLDLGFTAPSSTA
jgi:glutathionyl-hydroquinone reductase